MARGRPKVELMLSEAEEAQLSSIARSRSMAAALTQRAQIVLGCAAGESNHALAQRMALTDATVGKWRRRFLRYRIQGLYDELRPGRPRLISEERVARLIQKTLRGSPATARRTGACAKPPLRAASPRAACSATSSSSASSPTARELSSSPPIRFSSRSCAHTAGCT